MCKYMKQKQYFIKEINKKDLFKTFPRKKKQKIIEVFYLFYQKFLFYYLFNKSI